VVCSDIRR
jgi:NAD(P)-dependent dehydrogenase (short-subunit alcohol dehydrogenase family)